MGDNDTRIDAKRLALLDAKRLALEQAGTYLNQQDHDKGQKIIAEMFEMEHNTGVVKDKLSALNSLEK